jgi:GT2 family glycosyltransferase
MLSNKLNFSIIIPVFNRPDEIRELLLSLSEQKFTDFEVVVVEDGSEEDKQCKSVVDEFSSRFNVKYYLKNNSGPGLSRNYGAERADGQYLIFLDSDCLIPQNYLDIVNNELQNNYVDAFGGPDKSHQSFSDFQKAVNHSMTSFFTTGGIRGSTKRLSAFNPRSFNMGISREAFEKTGGFSTMRFGEDIDLSLRILQMGFNTRLFEDAFVYHKRRTSLKKFFKQVFNSGIARINLYKRHPQSLKAVYFLPSLFLLFLLTTMVLAIFSPFLLLPVIAYSILLFIDSLVKNKSLTVALYSIISGFTQLIGYGTGFLYAIFRRLVLKSDEFAQFEKTFYD